MIKIKQFLILAALFYSVELKAQSNVVTSGGDASGSGGVVNYSIGQIDYRTETGSNGEITQGVQQPYEILVLTGIDHPEIQLNSTVYPNPTDGMVTLSFDSENPKKIRYELYGVSGNVIRQKEVTGKSTSISLIELAEGIYYLNVIQDKTTIKSFKIIKNK